MDEDATILFLDRFAVRVARVIAFRNTVNVSGKIYSERQRGGVPFLLRNLIVVGFRSAGRLQRRPLVCFDHLEYFLISRVAAERIQIRVVLDPSAPQFVTGVRKQPFQQIKSLIYVA